MIRRWICLYAALLLIILSVNGTAQHEGHKMPAKPAATPSPSPSSSPKAETMPGMSPSTHPSNEMGSMSDNTTDQVVMKDDDMFIRVGTSEHNLIPMGGMGSGTSWQPVI